jgi:hypothetical protein
MEETWKRESARTLSSTGNRRNCSREAACGSAGIVGRFLIASSAMAARTIAVVTSAIAIVKSPDNW